jgi:hypothetical protein
MLAQGVGLDFRNFGSLYFPDGSFKGLDKIQIEYVEVERLDSGDGAHAMAFPKWWVVRAEAEGEASSIRGVESHQRLGWPAI